MRILITGAAGLYGVHLVDLLCRKGWISAIIGVDDFSRSFFTRDPFIKSHYFGKKFRLMRRRFQSLSVRLLDSLNLEVVIHLAAGISIPESMAKPEDYFLNNEYGTFQLIHKLLKTKKHPLFIYASTPEVYGNPQYVPMDIHHPMDPRSIYAVTKLAAEKHCEALKKWYNYPIIIIRNFNTYGENQNVGSTSAVIPAFIKNALGGNPLIIESDGKQTRDFQYVKDAVMAYKLVLENREKVVGKVFNIGTGKQISIKELAKLIIRLCNSSSKMVYRKGRKVDIYSLEADFSETTKLVGWEPQYSLEAGLKRTINWFREYIKR